MRNIYVIGPKQGPFKVGISANVRQRVRELQTGNPYRLVVHYEKDVAAAELLEGRFHAKHSARRLFGEWFDMDLADIICAIDNECAHQTVEFTCATFDAWVGSMKANGLARDRNHCAELLQASEAEIEMFNTCGMDTITALACRALFHRLQPWE